jgi:hypothetical protein
MIEVAKFKVDQIKDFKILEKPSEKVDNKYGDPAIVEAVEAAEN